VKYAPAFYYPSCYYTNNVWWKIQLMKLLNVYFQHCPNTRILDSYTPLQLVSTNHPHFKIFP
jgi:hypothetical protein